MSERTRRRDAWIDRLALRLSGLGEAEGRELAVLVAERLAAADIDAAGADIGAVRVRLGAGSDVKLPRLSEQIAQAIVRHLGGSA